MNYIFFHIFLQRAFISPSAFARATAPYLSTFGGNIIVVMINTQYNVHMVIDCEWGKIPNLSRASGAGFEKCCIKTLTYKNSIWSVCTESVVYLQFIILSFIYTAIIEAHTSRSMGDTPLGACMQLRQGRCETSLVAVQVFALFCSTGIGTALWCTRGT